MIRAYEIPITITVFAKTPEEAVDLAEREAKHLQDNNGTVGEPVEVTPEHPAYEFLEPMLHDLNVDMSDLEA